ncbi:hypothetical protein [Streptomyces anulatus]|uniref:hypothetical protein n=1 Tax=Streptomyces anulatus TaxID=1892 RepID=UPI0033CAB3E7
MRKQAREQAWKEARNAVTRRPARAAGIEVAAVRALAVAVYAAAVGTSVLAGPWMLVLFLPAMIGSVVAVRLVRRGALGCAGGRSRPEDPGGLRQSGP